MDRSRVTWLCWVRIRVVSCVRPPLQCETLVTRPACRLLTWLNIVRTSVVNRVPLVLDVKVVTVVLVLGRGTCCRMIWLVRVVTVGLVAVVALGGGGLA